MFEQRPLAGLHELRLPGPFWQEVLAALRRRRARPDRRPRYEPKTADPGRVEKS